MVHDGMPHDPIQGQGQGHRASKFPNIALLKLSPLPLTVGPGIISEFDWAGFLIFVLVLYHVTLNLVVPAVSPSRKSFSDFNEILYVDTGR